MWYVTIFYIPVCGSVKLLLWMINYTYVARQSSAVTVHCHPLITNHPAPQFCSWHHNTGMILFIHQWSKEPNMEILIQNTLVQHLNLPILATELLILYTVTLKITININQMSVFVNFCCSNQSQQPLWWRSDLFG